MLGAALLGSPPSLQGWTPRLDLGAGRFLKVQKEAEARIAATPRDALAWAARSQALSAQQRFPEALATAQRALEFQPGLADALLARGLAQAGTALQQRNLSSLRHINRALADLEAATQVDPSLGTAWMTLGLAYQELPGLLGGSTRKALRCAEALRKIEPARGDALQGTLLALDARWKEAQPFFGRALALAPQDPEVAWAYLDALGKKETRKTLGEAEQKRLLAQEALRLHPGLRTRAKALEAIADALLDAGQAEEAWGLLTEALKAPQLDAPSLVRLQLGKLAARSGLHREEGLAHLDRLLKEPLEGGSGGRPAAHWRRAQILRDLGRKPEAREAAQEALTLDPKHPGAKKVLEGMG